MSYIRGLNFVVDGLNSPELPSPQNWVSYSFQLVQLKKHLSHIDVSFPTIRDLIITHTLIYLVKPVSVSLSSPTLSRVLLSLNSCDLNLHFDLKLELLKL